MTTSQLLEYFNVSIPIIRNFLKNNNIFEFRKNK